ncbi:MAG: GNAT family N-acetyltransferase [Anaerolineae bacterium]
MNLNDVTIRPMQAAEMEQVAAMRAAGFGGNPEQTLARMQSNPRYDASHVLVAEHAGALVGTGTVFPAQMWLSGVPMDVGAVAGVTVPADFRNNGIATKLMQHAIGQMHANGRALSALFPFSHKYYRALGYGTIGDLHAYSFTPDNVAVSGSVENVRPFEPGDLAMLRAVYKGQMTWHNGWFTRSNDWWAKIIERWPNIVVFDNDGFIDGYLIYQRDGQNALEIKEFFSAEPEAYQGLLAWLAAQNVARIDYLAPADTPLRHSLSQPYAAGGQNRGWIFNDLCHVTPGPVGRIINLPKAFTTRFYTRGVSGELTFKVSDPLIPANEEPIVFRLVDGRAETRPAQGKLSSAIETDITTLTQILCGYMKAVDARKLGRFAADEDSCSWLDKIIVDTPLFIQAGDWF